MEYMGNLTMGYEWNIWECSLNGGGLIRVNNGMWNKIWFNNC